MTTKNVTQESAITQYLAEIEVKPTSRFYQRIARKPWMLGTNETTANPTWGSSLLNLRTALVGVALALLLLVLIFQVPPLRLLAQQILSRFVQQPTDTIAQAELFNGNGEYIQWQWDQKRAIENAEQMTGFDFAVPAVLPTGYRFEHIIFVPAEKVIFSEYIYSTLPYTDVLNDMAPVFTLSQQSLAHADLSPLLVKIGASAGVEVVSINGIQGEYVQGTWTSASSETSTVQWTWAACCRMLRWQTADYVFTLITHSYPNTPGFTGRDELVKIATNITFVKE